MHVLSMSREVIPAVCRDMMSEELDSVSLHGTSP